MATDKRASTIKRFSDAFTKYTKTKKRLEQLQSKKDHAIRLHEDDGMSYRNETQEKYDRNEATFTKRLRSQAKACIAEDDKLREYGLPSNPLFDRSAAEQDVKHE
jgi:hypothetical protein